MQCEFNLECFKTKHCFHFDRFNERSLRNIRCSYSVSNSFQRFFSLCLGYSMLLANSLRISLGIALEIVFTFLLLPMATIFISFSFLIALFPCLVPPGLPLQDVYHLFVNQAIWPVVGNFVVTSDLNYNHLIR